jgi:nicotinate-nucleotide adenylyltransferase
MTFRGIGIMGGTFDPIHNGHLFAAEEVMAALNLDKVVFVPSGTPPHKSYPAMASALERYEMTLLATVDNERFEISKIETDRPGMSYTFDTLKDMRDLFHGSDLFFITGVDAVLEIEQWREPFEISQLCTLVVVKRPGYDDDKLSELPEKIRRSMIGIDSEMLEISATDIRRRVREKQCIRYLVPDAVCAYIAKKNLYSSLGGESI